MDECDTKEMVKKLDSDNDASSSAGKFLDQFHECAQALMAKDGLTYLSSESRARLEEVLLEVNRTEQKGVGWDIKDVVTGKERGLGFVVHFAEKK